jgi:hypothetical protein
MMVGRIESSEPIRRISSATLFTCHLARDLPEHALRTGDLGAVVEAHAPDGLEIEFVTASGKPGAVVTLGVGDVQPVDDSDLVSVRPFERASQTYLPAATTRITRNSRG